MYEDFFYERLVRLRMNKNVSQREMSLSMGQSEGYMTKIESRVALPSMTVFFYICEYLGIHPKDFFDDNKKNPALLQEAQDGLKDLNDNDLCLVLGVIKRLQGG
ncbi:MAG: helix-turn-helix domain-containing protein [Lachnospiraceae bacterium]|jgi:transcriptional regulator with XRE-family HTH domain|nr:helix-turn-helix domain-containing protein [Lachnospiraceae bacterium]